MNKKELFRKLYNKEIKEDDVIVEHIHDYDEYYEHYIINDGYRFWQFDGEIVSLNFFINDEDDNYKTDYEIISKNEFNTIIEIKTKELKLQQLRTEISKLEVELNELKED